MFQGMKFLKRRFSQLGDKKNSIPMWNRPLNCMTHFGFPCQNLTKMTLPVKTISWNRRSWFWSGDGSPRARASFLHSNFSMEYVCKPYPWQCHEFTSIDDLAGQVRSGTILVDVVFRDSIEVGPVLQEVVLKSTPFLRWTGDKSAIRAGCGKPWWAFQSSYTNETSEGALASRWS